MLKTGYDSELMSCSPQERKRAGKFLIDLKPAKKPAPGLANLKVGYNRVHGYFIELPSKPESAPIDYQRRQTLGRAERFITPELKEFEDKALSVRARRGKRCSTKPCSRIWISRLAPLQDTAAALAELDVLNPPNVR